MGEPLWHLAPKIDVGSAGGITEPLVFSKRCVRVEGVATFPALDESSAGDVHSFVPAQVRELCIGLKQKKTNI